MSAVAVMEAEERPESLLPAHISEALDAIACLHERHEQSNRPVQRAVEAVTQQVARPGTVVALLLVTFAWLLLHILVPYDRVLRPPLEWIQLWLGLISVILTCMILTTQRRADMLASHRAHLTLELAILAEQKSAKTIALLEELRRDLPMLQDRVDDTAEELAQPTDPAMVIDELVKGETNEKDG